MGGSHLFLTETPDLTLLPRELFTAMLSLLSACPLQDLGAYSLERKREQEVEGTMVACQLRLLGSPEDLWGEECSGLNCCQLSLECNTSFALAVV